MTGDTNLENQIIDKRREISTEKMSMSIGELTSMYENGELIIRPSFQRLFRWSNEQRTRLIESILLGIPFPPIFVSTDRVGRWEIIDGLQRVSTLLQLQGMLKGEGGRMVAPLVMGGTEYLPALEGAAWDGAGAALSEGQKRDILRARVDLIIINRGSDPSAKFDLFQRLNSLGSPLSAQEVRNAMLYSMDGDVADWVIRLSERDSFVRMMNINAAQRVNAYAQEMVLRFLALHDGNAGDLSGSGYLTTFLDNFAIELCEMKPGRRRDLEEIFALTFDYFGRAENDGIFNIVRDGEVVNKLSITTFEILALGVGYWAARGQLPFISPDDLNREYLATGFEITSSGKSAEQRMKHTIPYGRKFVSRNLQSKAQPREAYQQELDVDL